MKSGDHVVVEPDERSLATASLLHRPAADADHFTAALSLNTPYAPSRLWRSSLHRLAAAQLAGPGVDRRKRVAAHVWVRPDHDHPHRPFLGSSPFEADPPWTQDSPERSHAPSKSRRGSPGGGGRQNTRWPGPGADTQHIESARHRPENQPDRSDATARPRLAKHCPQPCLRLGISDPRRDIPPNEKSCKRTGRSLGMPLVKWGVRVPLPALVSSWRATPSGVRARGQRASERPSAPGGARPRGRGSHLLSPGKRKSALPSHRLRSSSIA